MKIRTLVRIGLAMVLLGVPGLITYGAWVWHNIEILVGQNERLHGHHQRIHSLATTIDYLTLVRMDPEVVEAMARDASALGQELQVFDHALTRLAVSHLEEIALIGKELAELPPGLDNPSSAHQSESATALLSRQLRIHHAGARESLSALQHLKDRRLREQTRNHLVSLAAVAMVFATLLLIMAILVRRRLAGPVSAINRGLQEVRQGNLEARIDLDQNDEFGLLAQSFNSMASARQKYQQKLAERIKEINCLYQVLELTSDTELDIDRIGKEIAQLIPISLIDPERAVARVILPSGREHRSTPWADPVISITKDVMVDDQVVGMVEFGYQQVPDWADHETEVFPDEERDLINGIALHLGRMIKNRRLAESLARSDRLKAIGELTGGISHDFNNLLTVILGNAELLEDSLAGQPDARLAEMITTAAQRGSKLTQHLLAFARRQALEPRNIDLNRMLMDMQDMLQRSLGEDIEINMKLTDELWPALVDPTQLESAILNLSLNARDAMPSGGRLALETDNIILDADYAAIHDEVDPGAYVMLAVSDNGHGIEPEALARVFEPFFTTKSHGTGLGLSMVFGLIKQSRGHIRIYSEPSEGTTVRLYLPRADRGSAIQEEAANDAIDDTVGQETILVVEDNDLVRKYSAARLGQWGYKVLEASSGREALDIVSRHGGIDLLFTDVVMPGMGGRELVRQAVEIQPGIKVLYTSGYTENAIVHHGRLDKGVNLLSKPYRASELRRRVRQALDQ